MTVRLEHIVFDAGTQIRAGINAQTVTDYAEQMTNGVQFPPIVVFTDGTCREDRTPIYYLADGFHRTQAALRNQFRDIQADVRQGTKDDALWFALGANRANGQRLTETDKRHALILAIQAFPERSMRQLAEHVGCSSTYASRVRDEVQTGLQPVDRVVGVDGRSYPASKSARDRTRERAAELLAGGKSVEEVRAEVGIGRDAAHQIKREIGAGVDKSKAAVAQRKKDISDMAARGFSTRQIAASVGLDDRTVMGITKAAGIVVHADRLVGKTKRHDANRIIERMAMDASTLCADVDLIDFADIDIARVAAWIDAFETARKQLATFIRRLKEQEKHGEAA